MILLLAEKMRPYKPVPTSSLRESFTTNASAFLFNNLVLNALSLSSLFVVAQRYGAHGLLHGIGGWPAEMGAFLRFLRLRRLLWHISGAQVGAALASPQGCITATRNIHVLDGLRFHVLDQLLEVA